MPVNKQQLVCIRNGQTSFLFDDKTLLEGLERAGIEVHYHCREGYCGACRTKMHAGQVEYVTDPLAFIDDDEILPCCCVPLSPLELETL